MRPLNLAIVGATGMVGRQMIKELDLYHIPIQNLYLFASEKSEGLTIDFRGKPVIVRTLNVDSTKIELDYALFSAGSTISKIYAPLFAKNKTIVIDNSSFFRTNQSVPLVVPEINPHQLKKHSNIIANPNCSTIIALLPIFPIFKTYGIKRVIYSTYQAVSGSGQKGVSDLNDGLLGKTPNYYPKQIAHNIIPIIDELLLNGNTKEEEKMIFETKKILENESILVSATCVRVPVFNGHSVSINLECKKDIDFDHIKSMLEKQEGIILMDEKSIPTPLDVSGKDVVYVGRLRIDQSLKNTINFFVTGDNIRKGAAANAVQILIKLMEENNETI
jgi:aspartate-semialdehyde dehydrogenase